MPYFTINEFIQSGKFKSLFVNRATGSAEVGINTNGFIAFDNPERFQIKSGRCRKCTSRGLHVVEQCIDMVKDPIVLTVGPVPATIPTVREQANQQTTLGPTTAEPTPTPTSGPAHRKDKNECSDTGNDSCSNSRQRWGNQQNAVTISKNPKLIITQPQNEHHSVNVTFDCYGLEEDGGRLMWLAIAKL